MEFAYFGYRNWAENILKNLREEDIKIDSFTIPQTEYSRLEELESKVINRNEIGDLNLGKYHALFFYGWSWIIPDGIVRNNECICLHPSPLPKYRGGSPLQHQIINGEGESAVTLFRMDSGIDTGPIYYQEPFSLEGSLSDIFGRISNVGSNLTKKLVRDFESGRAIPSPQNEEEATFFKRRGPEESELTLKMMEEMTAEEIYNFVRALEDPYPNAYFLGKKGKKVYLKRSSLI